MNRQVIAGIIAEEVAQPHPVNNLLVGGILDLVEPQPDADVDLRVGEREEVPRNENFYEETIPQYLGDLFIQHFRMSRAHVDVIFI